MAARVVEPARRVGHDLGRVDDDVPLSEQVLGAHAAATAGRAVERHPDRPQRAQTREATDDAAPEHPDDAGSSPSAAAAAATPSTFVLQLERRPGDPRGGGACAAHKAGDRDAGGAGRGGTARGGTGVRGGGCAAAAAGRDEDWGRPRHRSLKKCI